MRDQDLDALTRVCRAGAEGLALGEITVSALAALKAVGFLIAAKHQLYATAAGIAALEGSLDEERWAPVAGFAGKYEISNLGRVRSLLYVTKRRPAPLYRKQVLVRGYPRIGLAVRYQPQTHREVLRAFVGEPPAGHEGAHLDGNRLNSRLDNLLWTTRKVNHSHKRLHGTLPIGEAHVGSRLTERQVIEARGLIASGAAMADIVDRYPVSRNALVLAVCGKTWAHLPGATGNIPRRCDRRGRPGCISNVLDEARVATIKARLLAGESTASVARAFAVRRSTIDAVKRGRNWGHVAPDARITRTGASAAQQRRFG